MVSTSILTPHHTHHLSTPQTFCELWLCIFFKQHDIFNLYIRASYNLAFAEIFSALKRYTNETNDCKKNNRNNCHACSKQQVSAVQRYAEWLHGNCCWQCCCWSAELLSAVHVTPLTLSPPCPCSGAWSPATSGAWSPLHSGTDFLTRELLVKYSCHQQEPEPGLEHSHQ